MENEIFEKMSLKLGDIGFKVSTCSMANFISIIDGIEIPRSQNLFDERIYEKYSDSFRFEIPAELPGAQSIIIVASPQPPLIVTFTVDGKPFETIVPPTYPYHTDNVSRSCIDEILSAYGHKTYPAALPKKLLAVRTGLASYGLNNIAYVDGMGSFFRISLFFTDAPGLPDNWGEFRMLKRCESCIACRIKCPTGAIGEDRFLLHAEKCLTFHNESVKDFPGWIDPSWHNALMGCMDCQSFCPENKLFVRNLKRSVIFSAEETELILNKTSFEKLSSKSKEKIVETGLTDEYDCIPRNLRALLDKASVIV